MCGDLEDLQVLTLRKFVSCDLPTERISVNATKELGWGDMLEMGEKLMQTPAGDNARDDESWGSQKTLSCWL